MTESLNNATSSRRWLYAGGGCLSILVLLLVLMGTWIASVPTERRATSRLELNLSPEIVWTTVTDREFQARSNDEIGEGFVIVDEAGDVVEMGPAEFTMEASAARFPRTCTVSMGFNSLWTKSWTWKLEPIGDGCRVTLEENVVRRSIFTRAFVALQRSDQDGLKHIEVDRFLRSLAEAHGSDAVPVHVE